MTLSMFIAAVDFTVPIIGLASIQSGLGASNAQLLWLTDAYTLTFSTLTFAAGLLGDRFGRRLIMITGLAIFTVASLAAAWSSTPGELIGYRALMGIGAAVVPGCSVAVIASVFPPEERARALGLWSMAIGVGPAVGFVLGGALVGAFWWGSLLLTNVPIAVLAIALIAVLVPENSNPAGGRLDWAGALLSIGGVGALVYGVIKGGESESWFDPVVLVPIAAGLALIAGLISAELKMTNPSFDPSLFRNRRFAIGASNMAATFFLGGGVMYVLSSYVQQFRGYSALQTGLLMLPWAVGSTLAGAQAARAVTWFGQAGVLGLTGTWTFASVLVYTTLDAHTPLWLFEMAQALFGVSTGAAFAVGMSVTLSRVESDRMSAAAAAANTTRHMGTVLGLAVLGSLLGSVYRNSITSQGEALPVEATTSLGSTLQAVAAVPGERREAILTQAASAFLHGVHATMWVSAGLSLLTATVAVTGLGARTPLGRHRLVRGDRRTWPPSGGIAPPANGPKGRHRLHLRDADVTPKAL